MAADVQKNAFNLSEATIMMAPFGTDPFSLTPALHSVGMAKEVAVTLDADSVQLRKGIQQILVDSKRSNVRVGITGNIYEYSAQNLLRSMSLASAAVTVKRGVLASQAAGSAATLSITSDPIPGEATSAITATGDIPSGTTLLIQRAGVDNDYVFPTKSSGSATGSGPYSVPIAGDYIVPAGMSFPAGSRVWVVNDIPVGTLAEEDIFGVKIVGTLSNFERPVTFIAPKVKVIKGFSLSFSETDYGSMPWEMEPYLLSAAEATGRLADIGTRRLGVLFVGA